LTTTHDHDHREQFNFDTRAIKNCGVHQKGPQPDNNCTAEVGTSRVVGVTKEECLERNVRVSVVCLTGKACTIYEAGMASPFYDFGVADVSPELVITRSVRNYSALKKVTNLDVIIWDEVSMLSARNV